MAKKKAKAVVTTKEAKVTRDKLFRELRWAFCNLPANPPRTSTSGWVPKKTTEWKSRKARIKEMVDNYFQSVK